MKQWPNIESGKGQAERMFRDFTETGLHQYTSTFEKRFVNYISKLECEAKKIREEKEQVYQFFNMSVDGMAILDFEFKINLANPAFLKVLELSQRKLQALNLEHYKKLIHPADFEVTFEACRRIIGGENIKYIENRFLTKRGYKWLGWTCFSDIEKRLMYVAVRDITRMKSASKKLEESELRFKTIVENMLDCFGVYSAVRDQRGRIVDFKYEYLNEAACSMTGLTKCSLVNAGVAELFPGQDGKGMFKEFCEVVETGKPLRIESWGYEKNGLRLAIDIQAAKLGDGFTISWRDITARKLAEEELKVSEERFSKAFNCSPAMMSVVSLETGCYINVNDTWSAATGYSKEEVIGKRWWDIKLFDGGHQESNCEKVMGGETVKNLSGKYRTKTGEVREALLSTEIIEVQGTKCLLNVSIDTTEQKRFEREIARLDRLNLIGQLAAGISHEIRNPMTTIKGLLQLFINKEKFAAEREHLELMISEIDRANSIITEFLALSKKKPEGLVANNLNSIVKKIFPLLKAQACEENKEISFLPGDIADCCFNEKEIRQVILNVVKNALDAVPKKGKVGITTFMEKGKVVLSVQDNGTGIDPEVLPELGTPFLTTKDNGTGLGLAICYNIIERHKGRVVVNTSSKGTVFNIHLPVFVNEVEGACP